MTAVTLTFVLIKHLCPLAVFWTKVRYVTINECFQHFSGVSKECKEQELNNLFCVEDLQEQDGDNESLVPLPSKMQNIYHKTQSKRLYVLRYTTTVRDGLA